MWGTPQSSRTMVMPCARVRQAATFGSSAGAEGVDDEQDAATRASSRTSFLMVRDFTGFSGFSSFGLPRSDLEAVEGSGRGVRSGSALEEVGRLQHQLMVLPAEEVSRKAGL